jgi:hypothetical protein
VGWVGLGVVGVLVVVVFVVEVGVGHATS